MENGIGNLATDEVVKDVLPTEEVTDIETPIVEDEKELENVELEDSLLKSDDEKTLNEKIYEDSLKEEGKLNEQLPTDEYELPEPTLEEKQESIDEIVDDIKDALDVQDGDELTTETLEKMATIFFEKEESYKRQIRQGEIAYKTLEKSYEKVLDELNDLKYDPKRIVVEDESLGYFASIYKKFSKNPSDKNVQKELAKFHMSGLKQLYPEFDPVEASRTINDKRRAAINAVAAASESAGGMNKTETNKPMKPKGFMINL